MQTGRISSFHSLSTVDGPGIRAVAFLQGCPLRCKYCHNPETQSLQGGTEITSVELVNKVLRLKDYFDEQGGLTLTGGEPLVQLLFALEVFTLLKENGLSTCLETSGQYTGGFEQSSEKLTQLLGVTDYIYCDVKFKSAELYHEHTKGNISKTLDFLNLCNSLGKTVIVRQVIVPTLNDTFEDMFYLTRLLESYNNISKIELLPYSTMGIHKYAEMGRLYELDGIESCSKDKLDELQQYVNLLYKREV